MDYKVAIHIDNFPSLMIFFGDRNVSELLAKLKDTIEDFAQGCEITYAKGGTFFVSGFRSEQEAKHFGMQVVMDLEGKLFNVYEFNIPLGVHVGVAKGSDEIALAVANQCKLLGKRVCSLRDILSEQELGLKLSRLKLLEEAIREDRIEPVFHPIVNNELRSVEKFEVLTRVITKQGKSVSVGKFADVLWEWDFYTDVTLISFSKAKEIISRYPYEFSLNLSLSDIGNRTLVDFITNIASNNPSVGQKLILELLEVESDRDYRRFKEFAQDMERFGMHIAIDDFGTGYSNLERVIELGPKYIKIDGSIIKRIDKEKKAFSLVRSISVFCRDVGIDTVAEFVENEDIYYIVRGLGITYSQGYYFYKPLSADEFLKEFG